MSRIQGQWLGSNELSADMQRQAPARIVSFAAAEPLDTQGVFNKASLKEVEKAVAEKGLKGLLLLLTPPYWLLHRLPLHRTHPSKHSMWE